MRNFNKKPLNLDEIVKLTTLSRKIMRSAEDEFPYSDVEKVLQILGIAYKVHGHEDEVHTVYVVKCECDPGETCEEYAVLKNSNKFEQENLLGYIEFYQPWNKFIFEPMYWGALTEENTSIITAHMSELEAKRKARIMCPEEDEKHD